MYDVSFRHENDTLVISLSGNIDSGNAPDIERDIKKAKDEAPVSAIVIDCDGLKYSTSAGLRIMLRLKQQIDDTRIINAHSEVYEVLDMTGFTELMKVEKAYRVLSVEGCEVIGQGANGKVYRIDRDTIVKVYMNPDALPEIHRERELARTAFVAGVPTAIPYDVVRIAGGGYGSVFELLNARSFASLLTGGEKTVDEMAEMSIKLLRIIHSRLVKPDVMPDMKAIALNWADFLRDYLPAQAYDKLHALIKAVPEDMHMMHGDYHIKNVMLQGDEVLLIDMDTLCHGHPIFELASMYNAYCGYYVTSPDKVDDFLGIDRETADRFWRKSLELYLGTTDEKTILEVENKAKVIGHARIMRRAIRRKGFDTLEGRAVIENSRNLLLDLLPRMDSLLF